MKGLQGKAAIVTGGSRGIGRAVVERLLEDDVKVLFTGRKASTGEAVLAELREHYRTPAVFLAGDMADEAFCEKAVKTTLERFNRLDFLVNNAFPFTAKGLNAQRKDWLHSMEAGPIAYATMIQQYVINRGKDQPGAIVNMSSIAAHMPDKGRWTYCAAKGAVTMITRCAAVDLAPKVRVNSITAGSVWTEEVYKAQGGMPERKINDPVFGKIHLIDRVILAEEMASAVAYLLSDESSAMTGADMAVDGGFGNIGPSGWKYEFDWKDSAD